LPTSAVTRPDPLSSNRLAAKACAKTA
jgi:hypothetical protein